MQSPTETGSVARVRLGRGQRGDDVLGLRKSRVTHGYTLAKIQLRSV